MSEELLISTVVKDLSIGILAGVICTAVLCFIGRYYKFGAEKIVVDNIDKAKKYIWQIENKISYSEDYNNIMSCVENLRECLLVIHQNLYPINFITKHKNVKLIRTLLYDATRFCESFLFSTVGYNGKDEVESRLDKARGRLYRSDINKKYSILTIQMEFVELLLKMDINLAIKKIENKCNNISEYIIEINSYKTSDNGWPIQKQGITREEFKKILNIAIKSKIV